MIQQFKDLNINCDDKKYGKIIDVKEFSEAAKYV